MHLSVPCKFDWNFFAATALHQSEKVHTSIWKQLAFESVDWSDCVDVKLTTTAGASQLRPRPSSSRGLLGVFVVRHFSIVICMGLLWVVVPQAALSQNWECGERSNLPQQGMNHCAWQDYRTADRALNKAWKTLRKNSTSESGKPDLMLEAQRAWLAFRDKQCEAEGSKFEGGTLQPFIISTCLTRFTYSRVDEILRYAEDH